MTRRSRHLLFIVTVIVLGTGILGATAWLVWYDARHGRDAAGLKTGDEPPNLGVPQRNVNADIQRVQRTLRADGFLGLCFTRFQRRAGRFPASLDELFQRPADLPPARWDGPYLSSKEVLLDPWERPYRYRCPGTHNDRTYDLWSVGPDGTDGTADDIGNW